VTTTISILLIVSLAGLLGAAAVGLAAAVAVVGRRMPATPLGGGPATATPAGSRIAVWGVAVAAVALTAAVLLRAATVGHAPWSNLHEFSVAFAATLLLGYLVVARTQPVDGLAPLVALLAAGLVGVALGLDDRVDPLVPALQQPLLLTIHVGSAALAYAVSGIAFVAAVAEIGQRAARNRIPALPSAGVARAVGHRAVLVAFPILTIAIVLGSVWANLAWRAYWSNDPKELAAAATWLVFGAYLHAAGRTDRWGRFAPWLIVLGFAGVLFTYIGAGLFIVGEHSYGAP
jgi:ABC-type transport system involved in cytochrome c biogenesis permease subunit